MQCVEKRPELRRALCWGGFGVWLTLIAGCASSPPASYQLGLPPKPAVDSSVSKTVRGAFVLLGPIQLPDYLTGTQLMQRDPDGRLYPDQQAHWAGRIQDNVDRALLHGLAEQLQMQRLVLFSEREGFKHQWQVVVRIDRLDSGAQQPAVLEGQWRVLNAQGEQQSTRIVRLQENHTPDLTDQVRAQSLLLHHLAEQMARDIQWVILEREANSKNPSSTTSAKARTSAAGKKSGTEADTKSKPAAGAKPLRTDMDVYRF